MTITQAQIRRNELMRFAKIVLVEMHIENGGLMGRAVYSRWTKEELVNEILYHEGF